MSLPTCQHVLDFLSDYLAEQLPPDTRGRFDEHLRLCPECRDYLENFRSATDCAKSALANVKIEPIPEELVQAILKSRPPA